MAGDAAHQLGGISPARWRRNSNVDTRRVDDDLLFAKQRNEVLHRLAVEIEIGNFFSPVR
jgi:hypothetical protein